MLYVCLPFDLFLNTNLPWDVCLILPRHTKKTSSYFRTSEFMGGMYRHIPSRSMRPIRLVWFEDNLVWRCRDIPGGGSWPLFFTMEEISLWILWCNFNHLYCAKAGGEYTFLIRLFRISSSPNIVELSRDSSADFPHQNLP